MVGEVVDVNQWSQRLEPLMGVRSGRQIMGREAQSATMASAANSHGRTRLNSCKQRRESVVE